MRILCDLLRVTLIAVFLAGLAAPLPVMAASCAGHTQPAECADQMGADHHHAMTPGKTDPAAPEGCMHHCLAASMTPDPVQPPARAERISRFFPPAVLSLLALVTPEPEGPPPRV